MVGFMSKNESNQSDLEDLIAEMSNADQPTCNYENPEDCDACGS